MNGITLATIWFNVTCGGATPFGKTPPSPPAATETPSEDFSAISSAKNRRSLCAVEGRSGLPNLTSVFRNWAM